MVDDVDLGLADADGLKKDVLAAGRVHQQRRLERRFAEPAKRATVRHRADKDSLIKEVVGQTDPIAEQRALREGRGWIDREHADAATLLAPQRGERADQS